LSQTGNKKRLGRGLEALLGPQTTDTKADGSLEQLQLSRIDSNPFQPRTTMDPEALGELKQSLDSSGLLQPVVVRKHGNRFQLIAGQRRCTAAQELGWKEISAVVREADDRDLLTLALVENIQRDSLSAIDEALGYQKLIDQFDTSQAEVADVVGKSRSSVTNGLRLLKLPTPVQNLVHSGDLSAGHARALLQVQDPAQLLALATEAVENKFSVRQLEDLGKKNGKGGRRRPRERRVDPEIRRIEEELRRHLKTDVLVAPRSKGSGRIWFNFYSNDDLSRLLELILGKPYEG
jgi:ParB family chromosome partitioning protein